jgi:hypothetical protein
MTITHSPPVTPTGVRKLVFTPASIDINHGYVVDLVDWVTTQKEPQELEVTLWPRSDAPGTNYPAKPRRSTFETVMVELEWTPGAGGSEAISLSTLAPLHDQPSRYRAQAWLPDHGMRFRIACRALRLKLRCITQNTFEISAAVAPVIGGIPSPPFPSKTLLYSDPYRIPIGATEFCVQASSAHRWYWVRFLNAGSSFGTTPAASDVDLLSFYVADCIEWQSIPGDAVAVYAGLLSGGTFNPTIPSNLPLTIAYR